MKNRIYTSLLFGISVAFSVSGHAVIKPASKHATAKTISADHVRSKHTKPVNKKKSIPTDMLIASKKTVAAPKSTTKKQAIVSAKLKNSKQSIDWYKSSHKTHSIVSFEPVTRKHTVITSKSIESDQIVHTNNDNQFRPILIDHPQSTKINTAHVSIETSLFLDGLEAGLSKELILQLTDIFAWDIDFATNLHPGDQFTIVYGKKMVDSKETDGDEIIAAEFINQGMSYTAIRYINESGIASYYTPDGQSMQRAFLSTPVDFARISSHFDMHRKHPILNRIRAHKGIDYAARTGTPVKTTGDGIVTFSGRKGAYGQVVIVQHNDHYETLYAHMSDFKKGLTVGDHVKQGDIIGYVGQTGLATGPHLHYEFHVDGVYRDPETVKIPHSMPISNALLADFKAQTQPFFAQLNQVKAKSLFAKTPSSYD
ncbi:MAG: M23 family metallopeptidase [Methylobacter sp.]|nr:M23 family metallopeptidase [Methylobacter sp.]